MNKTRIKNGIAKGENNGRSKINYEKFCIIKNEIANRNESKMATFKKLAFIYGVSYRTIQRIDLGQHHFEEKWRNNNGA